MTVHDSWLVHTAQWLPRRDSALSTQPASCPFSEHLHISGVGRKSSWIESGGIAVAYQLDLSVYLVSDSFALTTIEMSEKELVDCSVFCVILRLHRWPLKLRWLFINYEHWYLIGEMPKQKLFVNSSMEIDPFNISYLIEVFYKGFDVIFLEN